MTDGELWLHGNTRRLDATWYTICNQVDMAKRLELCPVETTARIVGGRWKGAVLEQLFQGAKRFSELKRGIAGITQRTLSQQLRQLQSTGIVERTVYPDTPPRVVYAITPLGKSLRPLLEALCATGAGRTRLRWR